MPKKLLLADDSITIQKVVGITFAQEDFDITYVDNGADAITKAQSLRPDIVLADIVMPQKNGYDVCEAIKKNPELKQIPVLLLAGTFETFDVNRGKLVGADDYIIKPFESQALIDKVNGLLQGKPAGTASPAAASPAPVKTPPPPPVQAAPTPAPVAAPKPSESVDFALDTPMFSDEPTNAVAETGTAKDDFAFDTSGSFDLGAESTEAAPGNGGIEITSAAEIMMDNMQQSTVAEPIDRGGRGEIELPAEQPGAEFGLDNYALGSDLVGGGSSDHAMAEGLDLPPLPEASFESSVVPAAEGAQFDMPETASAAAPRVEPKIEIDEAEVKRLVEARVREVLEKVAWEIVPELAERLIKDEIQRLTSSAGSAPKA